MNVFQLISGTGVNGAIRHCYDLTCALAKRGHRVLLGHKAGAWIATMPFPEGVERMKVTLKRRPAELKRVAAALKERQIDVIHTHNSSGHFTGALLSMFWNFPRVGTSHNTFFQFQWRFCDRIIAPTQATARFQRRVNLIPGGRIDVIPNFIDAGRMAPQCPREEARAALGADSDTFLILTVGEVFPRKNQELLVRTVPSLLAAGMKPLVLLVGKVHDDYRRVLEPHLTDPRVNAAVHLAGQRSDIPDLLGAADVFCLPSRSEVMPIALLESMAQGLPVVATDVGGVAELVRDGRDGIITPSGDLPRLTAALLRMWQEPETRRCMSHTGREHVAEVYAPEVCLPAVEECYRRAIARRRGTN